MSKRSPEQGRSQHTDGPVSRAEVLPVGHDAQLAEFLPLLHNFLFSICLCFCSNSSRRKRKWIFLGTKILVMSLPL